MSHRIICPVCKTNLCIADGFEGDWYTCPSCLASLSSALLETAQDTVTTATETSIKASPGGTFQSPDVDVRQDSRLIGCGVLVAICLGTVGAGFLGGRAGGPALVVICGVGGVLLLVAVRTVLVRETGNAPGIVESVAVVVSVLMGAAAAVILFFCACAVGLLQNIGSGPFR